VLFWLVTWSVILLAVPPRLVLHNGHFDNIVIFLYFTYLFVPLCIFHDTVYSTWETLTVLSGYLALRFVCFDITTHVPKCFRRTSRFLLGVMLRLHSKYMYLFSSLVLTHGLHSESQLCCSAVKFIYFFYPVSFSLYVLIC